MDISQIISELAKKHNLTIGSTKLIADAQFSFVYKTMRDKQNKSVILPLLGKFAVKPNRLMTLTRKHGEQKQQTSGDTTGMEKPSVQNT